MGLWARRNLSHDRVRKILGDGGRTGLWTTVAARFAGRFLYAKRIGYAEEIVSWEGRRDPGGGMKARIWARCKRPYFTYSSYMGIM